MAGVEQSGFGWTPGSMSVVVPVLNERDNVRPLVEGILAALRPQGVPFEVIVVDDGSSDGTLTELAELRRSTPELVVIGLRRNFGQTLALLAGLDRTRGDAVVTMDGDLQNDPRDIPLLVRELSRGADFVSGWRRRRRDPLLLRKVPSWIANWLVRRITGARIHDQGCALKAYRGEIVRRLDLYADMHRFIGILTMSQGTSVAEVEVRHHARRSGTSHYGASRAFKVVLDLFTIQTLTRFRERPLRWFAVLGSPFLVGSLVATVLALVLGPAAIVLTPVALLAGMTFGSCLLLGLLGEAVIETSRRGGSRRVVFREWTNR